jgi:hypothetical protein
MWPLCPYKRGTTSVHVLDSIFHNNNHMFYGRYHRYVPLVVNTSRSFPHSRHITRFVTRLTRQIPLVEQELFTSILQQYWLRRVWRYQIRIRISKKNRQYNDQKKKYKRTDNNLQNIHIKLKIEATSVIRLLFHCRSDDLIRGRLLLFIH